MTTIRYLASVLRGAHRDHHMVRIVHAELGGGRSVLYPITDCCFAEAAFDEHRAVVCRRCRTEVDPVFATGWTNERELLADAASGLIDLHNNKENQP